MQRTVLFLLAVLTLVLCASTGSVYSSAGLACYSARLKSVTLDGSATSYEYDTNGNRAGGSYDAQDRLTAREGRTYTYTDAGSLLSKTDNGQTTTYRYDAVGNLRKVQLPSGEEIGYRVDGLGRRILRSKAGVTTDKYVWRGELQPVWWEDRNGVPARFVYALGGNAPEYLHKGGRLYRLLRDHLGSVRLVVRMDAVQQGEQVVVQKVEYDTWGKVTSESLADGFEPVPFGFAGGIYDRDTGLVRFGARDYDPEVGRWTSKDPLLFGGGDANLYVYVGNDPVNLADPEGLAIRGPNPWAGQRRLIDWTVKSVSDLLGMARSDANRGNYARAVLNVGLAGVAGGAGSISALLASPEWGMVGMATPITVEGALVNQLPVSLLQRWRQLMPWERFRLESEQQSSSKP